MKKLIKHFFYFFISIYSGVLFVKLVFALDGYFKSGIFIFNQESFYSPIKFSIVGSLLVLFTNSILPDSNKKIDKK